MSPVITSGLDGHRTLHQLPVELIVPIMKASPSLSDLWSFINTSIYFAAIFRGYAYEVTEHVLRCTVPDQTQIFLYAVLQLRLSHPPPSLRAARNVDQVSLDNFRHRLPSARTITPVIPRAFVSQAHEIHVLAHECIEHYIRKCMDMKPSWIEDRQWMQHQPLGEQQYLLNRHKGQQYDPKDAGPPSWAEEQLVILNLWRLQYYFDIRKTLVANRLGWSTADQQELLRMGLSGFYRQWHFPSFKIEQFLTVLEYTHKARNFERVPSAIMSLPCPITPERFDLPCSHELAPDYPDVARSLKTHHEESDRKVPKIEFRPVSDIFTAMMSHGGILSGLGLSNFRKFGFSLWEPRRMIDLGLSPPRTIFAGEEYCFI